MTRTVAPGVSIPDVLDGEPIHQLLMANDVSAFFHGHDHQYAYEMRDGIVYQELPSAGFSGYGFSLYSESDPVYDQSIAQPGPPSGYGFAIASNSDYVDQPRVNGMLPTHTPSTRMSLSTTVRVTSSPMKVAMVMWTALTWLHGWAGHRVSVWETLLWNSAGRIACS